MEKVMTQTNSPLDNNKKRERWVNFVQSLNPEIDPGAIRLMDQMRMVSHNLYQMGESSLASAGLSYARYRVLMGLMFCEEVEGRSELNPSEISERQGTSRNTISALIRDLEAEGLIERHLDRTDRRKFNIRLTEAGRARVHEHARRHFRIIGGCFSALTPEEQETLGRLLAKLGEQVGLAREQLATAPDSTAEGA
jgi:DNA-binding MarR family transcriptional regulator